MIHLSCPKKCGPSRSLFDHYTAPGCNFAALGTVQVQESGGREASSDQSNTDASYLTHQHCGHEGPNPCTTPHPAPTGKWMDACQGRYVPVQCLYKPAPVAVLKLIKCGCKTSCKGHCSCKKNNLPCTALCKCHNSDCSNPPDYRMIADEDDV